MDHITAFAGSGFAALYVTVIGAILLVAGLGVSIGALIYVLRLMGHARRNFAAGFRGDPAAVEVEQDEHARI